MITERRQRLENCFTLIELLVCISIIVLLMAILLPTLRKAKENGYKILCIGNLKQVGIAEGSYQSDNNSWTPTYSGSASATWNSQLYNNGYLPIPEVGKPCILVCPSHFTDYNKNKGTWLQGGRSYGMRYRYGYAFRILNQVTDSAGKTHGRPTAFILFADSNHSTSAIDYQWYIFMNYQVGNPVHLRHLNRCNVLFGDGHADSLDSQQLTNEYSFIPGTIIK